jgi:hypothetical protein
VVSALPSGCGSALCAGIIVVGCLSLSSLDLEEIATALTDQTDYQH